ncbi:hypothetical protein [Bradyrhizobium sp. CCBAU 53421]|uniref:hypothetical protein n=1 Tax=Bradyrhizobium sp. CCBAU 53421 TaxID=1325120 RepID=UPI00188ACD2F|nr:hypothetical protein [Bradyrhizobium sp. CCBAU 53421]
MSDVATAERAIGDALSNVDFLKEKFDVLVAQISEFLASMKESELKPAAALDAARNPTT